MDSTTPDTPPALPQRPRRCPDCGGRGTYRGHDVPVQCQTCWSSGTDPWIARLAQIRHAAEAVSPGADPRCIPAMLRDLLAENDRLTEAAFVRRAETLCEVAELLARVDMPAAAELVQAQVLLEHADPGTGAPLGHEVYQRVLAGLAAHSHPARRT